MKLLHVFEAPFSWFLVGGVDGHQMALLQLPRRRRIRTRDLSSSTGRSSAVQLYTLRTGQPAVCLATQTQTGRQGALDFLVGRRTQLE